VPLPWIGGSGDDAAWAFTHSPAGWQQLRKLTGAGAIGFPGFGGSVALTPDGTTGLVGGGFDNYGAGAVWAFAHSSAGWRQQGAKLTATGAAGSGGTTTGFGLSAALSADGTTALVADPSESGGVGAAWVFTHSGSVWTQRGGPLTGGGERGAGWFGQSVALSADGSTALIGGYEDAGGAGAAWVYERTGSVWRQQGVKLTGGETGSGWFGYGVALSADGNTALIGGPAANSGAGAAWVFTRTGSSWTQQGASLAASDETGAGSFGLSVSLSADGSSALIGGPARQGGAWVFTRSGTTWTQEGPKLAGTGETVTGHFGRTVALSADGHTALIGDADDHSGIGAAWVFARSGADWTQQGAKLTGGGEIGAGGFGTGVALTGDGKDALVGGPSDDRGVGAAWLFARTGSTWTQQGDKLVARDEAGAGAFGSSTALSSDGTTALIGGDRDDGSLGAAWVFGAGTRSLSGSAARSGANVVVAIR